MNSWRLPSRLLGCLISLGIATIIGGSIGCSTQPIEPSSVPTPSHPAGTLSARLAAPACEECRAALLTNAFCETCEVGYVAGLEVTDRAFHEFLDAHGHEIDPLTIQCLECAEAIEVDGFCRRCRMGYVDEQLYFTELTWSLHRGTAADAASIACAGCRPVFGTLGECETCDRSWVGNFFFDEPTHQKVAARQFHRLTVALERGYAFTNPIFIDADQDGQWQAPGLHEKLRGR